MLLRLMIAASAVACASAAASHGCSGPECTKEPADSKVNVLTADNFHRFVKRHPLVLMEFYAPWCGHCQSLGPEYRAAAKELAGMDLPVPVTLAKMDDGDDANRKLRGGADDMYNYSSYPSLLIFRGNSDPVNKCDYAEGHPGARTAPAADCWEFYGGGREMEDITFWLSTVSKGLNPYDEEAKLKPGLYKDTANGPVRDLDPDNFNSTVMADTPANNKLWIVEFYSDRCPICKGLVPEIKRAAKEIMAKWPGQIAVGAVNSRVYHDIAETHGITSYPWVTSFYKGKKVEDMAGLGGWESIYNFAQRKFDANWKPDTDQVLGCKSLSEGASALDSSKVKAGDEVTVVADEIKIKACVEEKGKSWEGKMKDKRGAYLGKSGTVTEIDTKKDAVLVKFGDKVEMWWGAIYMTAGGEKDEL